MTTCATVHMVLLIKANTAFEQCMTQGKLNESFKKGQLLSAKPKSAIVWSFLHIQSEVEDGCNNLYHLHTGRTYFSVMGFVICFL